MFENGGFEEAFEYDDRETGKAAGESDMTFLKSLDSPPFIATYRWAGLFDGRYMPQAYSLLLELNQNTHLPVVRAEFDICIISCGKEWWRWLVDVNLMNVRKEW